MAGGDGCSLAIWAVLSQGTGHRQSREFPTEMLYHEKSTKAWHKSVQSCLMGDSNSVMLRASTWTRGGNTGTREAAPPGLIHCNPHFHVVEDLEGMRMTQAQSMQK